MAAQDPNLRGIMVDDLARGRRPLGGLGGVAEFAVDASGNVTGLAGPDWNVRLPQMDDPSTPILCVGGDHPYEQWWGSNNDGLAKMYRDYGITPYLAINTDSSDGGPGGVNYMTWDQVRTLAANGVEIMSHSHRHVHQYGRMDTGIQIEYLGANGTATVDIDGTPKTLTLAGGAADNASFDLTNASYDTLAELATAINAVNGGASWRCTLASELSGSEASTALLSIIAPRSVVSPVAFEEYFAAGSGIICSYTGVAYKTAFAQVTSSSTFDIYLDGVRIGTFNLANASYDTLAELVAAIDALSITGLTADLCDETGGIYTHYTQGDEKSTELVKTLYQDLRQCGGVVLDGTGKANGSRFAAGLPHSYLIERQWQASIDAAATEGVTLRNWAQSGGGWHQYYYAGGGFRSYRTNQVERNRYPGAQFSAIGPDYIRTHCVLDSTNSAASIKATLRALAASPGSMIDLLCHALDPALPAGSNGYTIQASSSLNVVPENTWIDVLAYAKQLAEAGDLVVLTPEQARRRRKWAAKPQSLIWNANFENDGTAITATAGNSTKIPGWELQTNAAHITAATVDDLGGYYAVSVTTNATTNTDPVTCAMALERGKVYKVGARIRVTSYSSGNGVQLVVTPIIGALPGQLPDDASPQWSSVWAKADADVSMLVHVPVGRTEPPSVRGSVAGTFNISAGSTDTLSVTIDAYAAVTVTLTAGAARTAKQVADEINAAFAASATYTGKQEYWTVASVQGNRVVVASPYAGEEYWNRVVITGNGTATVFGASQCVSVPGYAGSPVYPVTFRARGQIVGSWSLIRPYCTEVDLAY